MRHRDETIRRVRAISSGVLLAVALLAFVLSWEQGPERGMLLTYCCVALFAPVLWFVRQEWRREFLLRAGLVLLCIGLLLLLAPLPYFVANDHDPELVIDRSLLAMTGYTAGLVPLLLVVMVLGLEASRLPTVAARTGLVIGAVMIGFVLLEGAIRYTMPPESHRVPTVNGSWWVINPGSPVRYGLRPNNTFHNEFSSNPRRYFGKANRVEHRINAAGYRGPMHTVDKPPGHYRVVILGDSYAMGWGVHWDDTVAMRLQRGLAKEKPGMTVEVIPFAAPGYHTVDELAVLTEKALAYQPDLIVVWYAINDVGGDFQPDKAAQAAASPPPKPWYRSVSKAVDLLLQKLTFTVLTRRESRSYLDHYMSNRAPWRANQAALLKIRDIAADAGAELVVTIEPVLVPLHPKEYFYRGAHKAILAFCKNNRLRCYDLWPVIDDLDYKKLIVHPNDSHSNEIAKQIFADHLLDRFVRDRVLEPPIPIDRLCHDAP